MRRSSDRAFLPAALEILETPPSPIRMALILAICALVAAALVWSWFGRFDVVAIAPGKIQPTGRVKVIQPIDAGKVIATPPQNGTAVAAGEVLVELDPREAQADESALTSALASWQAEVLRRRTVLAAARLAVPVASAIVWPDDMPAGIRRREQLVLEADIARLTADLASLEAQRIQKGAELIRLETTIRAQQDLLATENTRVGMRAELVERSAGSKAQLIDAQETHQVQQVNLATQQGQLAETRAALEVNARERIRVIEGFVAENSQKLADAERQLDDTRERLAKARARLEHMTITAPIAGTVTALAVTNIGQVVTTGEELLRLVPDGSTLELEGYLLNRDIGFVREGQAVVVKIEAFPFTRYGTLEGTVKRVAHDAVPEPDSQQAVAGGRARSTGAGGIQRTQNLVYPVTVELGRQEMIIDGRAVHLSPGMAAEAEIKTGDRRILEYIFSPLVEIGSSALKER
ncbi:HlyD family type I secretion periplasmic adaptor subunit [Siculibacillus lacustris]|uniref:Membrane fusion protein (MFP) family protein n=2 Tax=Siculibacillus lacustris TaxID=1549641 RepID=A0A4Q9VE14_9HYPH|nr:HlyD family type I secretion periplasmic adaptor subunit [Siculibacillus lacustris]